MAKIVLRGALFCLVTLHTSLALHDTGSFHNNYPLRVRMSPKSVPISYGRHLPNSDYPFGSRDPSNGKGHNILAPIENKNHFMTSHRDRRSVLSWFASYFQSELDVTEATKLNERISTDAAKQSHVALHQQITTPSQFSENTARSSTKLPQTRLEKSTSKPNEKRFKSQNTTRKPRSTESSKVAEFLKKVNPQTWLTTVSAFLHNGVNIEKLNATTSDLSNVSPLESSTPEYRYPVYGITKGESTQKVKRPHKMRPNRHHPDKIRNRSKIVQGGTFKMMKGDRIKQESILEMDTMENRERSQDTSSEPCKTCGSTDESGRSRTMSEEEVKVIRKNMIAELLMQKLRLDPRELKSYWDNRSHDKMKLPMLPRAVLDETRERNSLLKEEDDFFARDQEAIVTGDDMGRDCVGMRSTGCYDFKFNGEVKGEVETADLWFYKTDDRRDVNGQTFIVYELERPRGLYLLRRRNLIAREDSHIKEGWVKLNMTRPVRRWLEKRRDGEMLAIRCKTCGTHNYRAIFGTKHGYKPLLIIKYVDKYAMRVKRSEENCNPATECCKRPLEINFNEINLPTIFQPTNLAIGYCYGYCDGVDRFTYNHTSIKQRVRWTQDISDQTREQLKPCCVPLHLLDTYILSVENNIIVRKVLPKVIVDRCGCV